MEDILKGFSISLIALFAVLSFFSDLMNSIEGILSIGIIIIPIVISTCAGWIVAVIKKSK